MNKFLKELMTLATELNEAEGFNALTVINDMGLLYDEHVTELKKLHIADVRQQSELLKAFLKYRLDKPHSDFQTQDYDIEQFLKDFNVC